MISRVVALLGAVDLIITAICSLLGGGAACYLLLNERIFDALLVWFMFLFAMWFSLATYDNSYC